MLNPAQHSNPSDLELAKPPRKGKPVGWKLVDLKDRGQEPVCGWWTGTWCRSSEPW